MIEKERMTVTFIYLLKIYLISIIDHDISDTVLHMMDLASKMQKLNFNED